MKQKRCLGQIHPFDLGCVVFRAGQEILLRVKPDHTTCLRAAGATGALGGGGFADLRCGEGWKAAPGRMAGDACEPRVNYRRDPGNCHRGLCNVRSQDHLVLAAGSMARRCSETGRSPCSKCNEIPSARSRAAALPQNGVFPQHLEKNQYVALKTVAQQSGNGGGDPFVQRTMVGLCLIFDFEIVRRFSGG